MITEDYCSYELAKLLKEKGFDERSRIKYCQISDNEIFAVENEQVTIDEVYIPTHQMAMKWLREVHKLSVEISSTESGRWMALAYELGETRYFVEAYISTYDAYEEATEAAIKYCLENLI